MEYTWKLKSLKKTSIDSLSDFVFQTYWEKIGIDEDGFSGSFHGATPFPQDSSDVENFIPFNELTEDIVLEWIKAEVVGSYEDHVNMQIQRQIDEQRVPIDEVSEGQFPWSTDTIEEESTEDTTSEDTDTEE